MRGNSEVIALINLRLSELYNAILQFNTHAILCDSLGLPDLKRSLMDMASKKMDYAIKLTHRIISLEGVVNLNNINTVDIGDDIFIIMQYNHITEMNAISNLIDSITIAMKFQDYVTMEILEHILRNSDENLTYIEISSRKIS